MRSREGQLWKLGRHKLLCGDATDAGDVARLLRGASPQLMVTDPPYGVRYDPQWRARELKHKSAGRACTNDSQADWSSAWALFPGPIAYVWHAGRLSHVVARSLQDSGFEIRSQIIWAKHHFAISRGHYHWQHEPCFYAVRRYATANWKGDRKQSTLWHLDMKTVAQLRTGHCAQKPLEAMARPMRNNSTLGEVIYDPFLGSGTSIMAAEHENRVCYGLEIDPACVDMILDRWQRETGEPAKLI